MTSRVPAAAPSSSLHLIARVISLRDNRASQNLSVSHEESVYEGRGMLTPECEAVTVNFWRESWGGQQQCPLTLNVYSECDTLRTAFEGTNRTESQGEGFGLMLQRLDSHLLCR